MIIEPCLQVRSNTLISYNKYPRNPNKTLQKGVSVSNFFKVNQETNETERQAYSGMLTNGAKKRLTKCIELLVMASKQRLLLDKGSYRRFDLSFITLTLYSTDRNVSGKESHANCLEPFLQWMRRNYGCTTYIWKAELQKRGQIHYHITSDCFIPYREVQSKWNDLQKKAGYLDTFYNKFGRWNPPSTEIKSVKNKQNLTGYLIKEIVKGWQNNATVNGKVWDCSINLKKHQYFTTHADGYNMNIINTMVSRGEAEAVHTDHCSIFKFKSKPANCVLSDGDKQLFEDLMHNIRYKAIEYERKEPPPTVNKPFIKAQFDLFSSS